MPGTLPHAFSHDGASAFRPVLMLTALAARVICDFFSKGQSNNFELTWNDLKVVYMP